nr:MAG TPA: hypothetical protein [Caudoviricetes sp.]
MTLNDPAYYKEYLWNEIKNSFAGFERANDYTDPNNYIKLIRKDDNPINLYIHGINVEGELYHRKITRNNSALDKVTLNDEIYCSTAKYAAEFKHLFEYGPYGVAVELAISKDAELTPDGNGNYTSDDLIWVKFFQDEYNPDKFVLDFGNDDYKINGIRNVMNFVGLRVYPDSRTVMLRRNPVYKSPAYSTIEPSNDFNPDIVSDVSLAPVFYRSILDEDYRRCKWDGYGLLAGTVVGGQPDRNINPSDYHSKIPTNMVDSKYYGRNSDWGGNIARRIITGYPVKTSGMLLYPIENSDGSIDYYPFKMMVGVPEKYLSQDTILNRDLKELLRRYNPPQDNIRYLKSAVNVAEIDAIDTDRVNVFDSTSIIEMFRELVFALIRIKGDNASVRREVVARRNFDRAGWRAEDGQPLWDLTKKWFTSDDVEPTQMKFSHLIGPDLNNITHEHYSRTLKSGTISAARLREWYLNVLIDATKRSFYPSVESFFTNLSNGIENIYHKEIAGTSVASPTYESTPEILYDVDSGTFINRITPVNRPTKPENDAPRAEREQYNTLVDNYNTYVDKLNVRYGNFDYMKISESDKFDLSLPYQVKMPPEQFGNPQYDKPIDGMNPGDLIGFIAEMVYGIQDNDSVNVLNAIPGIYIPAVIPYQFRYSGRRDDVIKNQFTRTLNKWIELKPKTALVRDELDAIDDLVNELIMLSGNPTTPSGLEDGSVYSLSTLFKGSLYKERPPRLDNTVPTAPTIETNTSEHHSQPPAEVNPYTPEETKDYRVQFVGNDLTTGNAIFDVTESSGAQITGNIRAYYNDKQYEVGDNTNPGRFIVPNSDLPEHEAIWHFVIGYRGATQPAELKITTNGVSVPAKIVESHKPVFEPPMTAEPNGNVTLPDYDYRIVYDENGWILSTEPIASFNVERVDGGSLPDNIEVRYNGNKYEISGGRIVIPNNYLPAHDKTVSMKVAYTDAPEHRGSLVENVHLPAHHPHEFRIEKEEDPELDYDVKYRITLASGNEIQEDSLTIRHNNDVFNVNTFIAGAGEFIIRNEQLPGTNGNTWDFEVQYPHLGETVTSVVRDVEIPGRLRYIVQYDNVHDDGARYHVYQPARFADDREHRRNLESGRLIRGDKSYLISQGSALIPSSDLLSYNNPATRDTFIVEYSEGSQTYRDTTENVMVPPANYNIEDARRALDDEARRHREELEAANASTESAAHIDA